MPDELVVRKWQRDFANERKRRQEAEAKVAEIEQKKEHWYTRMQEFAVAQAEAIKLHDEAKSRIAALEADIEHRRAELEKRNADVQRLKARITKLEAHDKCDDERIKVREENMLREFHRAEKAQARIAEMERELHMALERETTLDGARCRAAEDAVQYERERDEALRRAEVAEAVAKTSDLPCGHSDQYAYSSDGGKHVLCLVCVLRERDEASDRMNAALRDVMQLRADLHAVESQRDEARAELDAPAHDLDRAVAYGERVTRERDEARAELEAEHKLVVENHRAWLIACAERDEARAEVARLRAFLMKMPVGQDAWDPEMQSDMDSTGTEGNGA